jgi:hypothetical protein
MGFISFRGRDSSFPNSAATARIPSGLEFIRNEESRKAGAKPVHGFLGSLSKQRFIQRLLTSLRPRGYDLAGVVSYFFYEWLTQFTS